MLPKALTFKSNETTARAAQLFDSIMHRTNNTGKAISLTLSIIRKEGFDMTKDEAVSLPIKTFVKQPEKTVEIAIQPSLFDQN